MMSRPRLSSGYTLQSVRGGTRTNQSAKKTMHQTTASLLKKEEKELKLIPYIKKYHMLITLKIKK